MAMTVIMITGPTHRPLQATVTCGYFPDGFFVYGVGPTPPSSLEQRERAREREM